jgi:glyoxylase-like metal-dependent hydrolase (beta-lactamase superfamily II)
VINTQEGVVCYAGDAANTIANLHENIIGNIIYDTEKSYKALDEIRKRSEFVICGHEPSLKNFQSSGFAKTHKE